MKNAETELLQEREATMAEMSRLRVALQSEVDDDVEEGDPNMYEREKILALLQNLERKLESVDRALRKVEKGSYGVCENCGNPIDPARLKAIPHAVLCIDCKARAERGVRVPR
ncbi:MAG: TraR/DksA family transcriptional regulator [Anaerolineae bacterium]